MDSYFGNDLDESESSVSDRTHAECLVLCRESTDTVRFAKTLQWKVLAYLTAVFVFMNIADRTGVANKDMAPAMVIVTFILVAIGISTLIIFQLWQSTEQRKLDFIADHISEAFRLTRAHKSSLEANIQRYAILTFMTQFVVAVSGFAYLNFARHLDL